MEKIHINRERNIPPYLFNGEILEMTADWRR
jgi:hypothetical protein